MNEEAGSRHPFRSALGLISAALLLVLLLAGLGGYRDLVSVRERAAELERRRQAADVRIAELKRRIASLAEDPATLERQARDQLGMVRPGDVVIVLERGAPPAPPPAATEAVPPGGPPERR